MKKQKPPDTFSPHYLESLQEFEVFLKEAFDPNKINLTTFEKKSAKAVTNALVNGLKKLVLSSPNAK